LKQFLSDAQRRLAESVQPPSPVFDTPKSPRPDDAAAQAEISFS